jgi:hypothetical protein
MGGMNPTIRKVLWAISVLGIATTVVICGLTFTASLADKLFPWLNPLFAVFFVLQIILLFDHAASTGTWSWRWNELTDGKPAWVVFWFYLLMANVVGHFIWQMHEKGRGVPAIINGEYVLDSHGNILKQLTADEYFGLRSFDLRMFAMVFLYLYFVHAIYWYYPSDDSQERLGP